MDSILTSIKKLLGIGEEYEAFDNDLIIHINSVLATLTQIGVGPKEGFSIEDDSAVWSDFISDVRLDSVKTYVYLKVKVVFDPPLNASVMEANKAMINELEWRLNVASESE